MPSPHVERRRAAMAANQVTQWRGARPGRAQRSAPCPTPKCRGRVEITSHSIRGTIDQCYVCGYEAPVTGRRLPPPEPARAPAADRRRGPRVQHAPTSCGCGCSRLCLPRERPSRPPNKYATDECRARALRQRMATLRAAGRLARPEGIQV